MYITITTELSNKYYLLKIITKITLLLNKTIPSPALCMSIFGCAKTITVLV
jgi:hypothetical protein